MSDVEAHLDRAIELINRTNQLNFVKRRLPEDIDTARTWLRRELSDFATQAGLIHVSDKYGDYGLCGYFQVLYAEGGRSASSVLFLVPNPRHGRGGLGVPAPGQARAGSPR